VGLVPRASVSGTIAVRPIRVGLEVDPQSRQDLTRAVELCTAAWGGLLNPLLPASSHDVARRLAEYFDVDVVASLNADDAGELWRDYRWHQVGERDGPFGYSESESFPMHVLPMDVVLSMRDSLAESRGIVPTWNDNDELSLLYTVLFGRYGDADREAAIGQAMTDTSDIVPIARGEAPPLEAFGFNPVRATMAAVHARGFTWDAGIAIVEPDSVEEMVQLWNLRANGAEFVPLPVGHQDSWTNLIRQWLSARVAAGLPHWGRDETNSLLSVWSNREPADDVVRSVCEDVGDRLPSGARIVLSRLDSGLRTSTLGPVSAVTEFSRVFDHEVRSDATEVRTPMPHVDVVPRSGWSQQYGQVAIETSIFSTWDMQPGQKMSAPAFRGFASALRPYVNPASGFVRATGEGIVVGVDASEDSVALPIITSGALIEAILDRRGARLSLGAEGRYVARLIELLDGARADSLANQPAARAVLSQASRSLEGKPINALFETARSSKGDWPRFTFRSQDYHRNVVYRLAHLKALTPKLRVRCFSCGNYLGVEPRDIDSDIVCELCGDDHPLGLLLATQRPEWRLDTVGHLADDRIRQTMSVMATLSVFSAMARHSGALPHHVLGLEVKKDDLNCELDIVLALQTQSGPCMVVAEVKSRGSIDDDDVANLRAVQHLFRESGVDCHVLVSVMRAELSADETSLLRALAESTPQPLLDTPGRYRYPTYPLIFTERELSVESMSEDHPATMLAGGTDLADLAIKLMERNLGLQEVGFTDERSPATPLLRWADQDDEAGTP